MKVPHQGLNKDRVFSAFIMLCGIISAGLGIAALIGWVAGAPILAAFLPGKIPMAPSTALLFLLYGAGVIILARLPLSRAAYRISVAIGATGVLAGIFFFVISLMGEHIAIEHLGINIAGMVNGVPVGYMSPLTALCFILAGLAFLSLLLPSGRPWHSAVAFGLAFLTILTSCSLLLAYFLGTPFLYGSRIIPPALPTSLAFFVLGAGLLFSSWQRAFSDGIAPDSPARRSAYMLVIIFVFLATGILTAGYLYFRDHEKHYMVKVGQELSAIKELKVNQIASWREERINDVMVLSGSQAVINSISRFIENENDHRSRAETLEIMSDLVKYYSYEKALLFDAEGRLMLSAGEMTEEAKSHAMGYIADAIQKEKIDFIDLHKDAAAGDIHFGLSVPLFLEVNKERRLVGMLILHIDPFKFLYPLIQSWPTPSRTGETLLIRREGDEIIYLNELRHLKDTAFSLRFPLSNKELPAAMAVLGIAGIVEGIDYRGVPVLASIGPIPGSQWFIVSKMDEEEIYSPMRERLWTVVILVGLLLLGSGLSIGIVWRQQRVYFYKERYQAELQLNEDLRKAKEEVKQYNRELKRSNEELQQFAYIASHDLQEPLRMIASYLQLIERRYRGKLDKDADEFIAFAVEGASRLQEMIIGLLAYSRVETKGKSFEEVNSAEVLGNAVANLKLAIEESGSLVTTGTLPVIKADASQLLQVFQNLISNAIKFRGKDAPLIHISAEQKGNEWVFSVKDNGVGIGAEYKEKVFDMFRRLHGREYPGVGIGLSLCRRIIERHKGRIWLESEAGQGTTFYFTIPIKGDEKR
ncbi:MAG: ATP-binding protein [Nitrospirota bacterium]